MTRIKLRNQLWGLALAIFGTMLIAGSVAAQSLQWSTTEVTSSLSPDVAFVPKHEVLTDGRLWLGWSVAPGYYIYQSSVKVTGSDGAIVLDLPDAVLTDDMTFGETWVYRHDFDLTLPPQTGSLTVEWQGCKENGICYPPQMTQISFGSAADISPAPDVNDNHLQGGMTLSDEPGLMERLGARGLPILLIAFFGFGLALAFTPCVLPMFPILGGLLARDGAGLTRSRGFTLSTAYVVSMATAFGLLGLAAAATGQNLQVALQSPLALSLIVLVFAILALSMFGLFEVRLPHSWLARLEGAGRAKRGTVGGALGLGFTSALVVGPCVTAPLAAALLYIGQTGDMALGSAALFMLGLGKGVPLVVFGTLGGSYLPKSGPWMVRVKQAFGFVFLGLAIWLAGRIVLGPLFVALWAAWLAAIGVFLLRSVLPDLSARMGRAIVRLSAFLVLFCAVILALTASRGAHDPLRPFDFAGPNMVDPLPWQSVAGRAGLSAALAAAEGPAIIYLTADWCLTCRTIERRILPDIAVVSALRPLTRIKLDLTDFDTEDQALLAILGAAGPPTMIFLDADLSEKRGTRLVGETRKGPILNSVQQVTQ